VIKLFLGLLKGAVIGGALGYGAYALGNATGFGNPWLTYGLIGALVGLFVGKPIWRLLKDNFWIAVLKSAFGFGIGCGLYAIIAKAWGPAPLMVGGFDVFSWPASLGGAIGAIYGGFVELDDAIGDDKGDKGEQKKLPESKPKQIAKK
jgi:hypothetical protein